MRADQMRRSMPRVTECSAKVAVWAFSPLVKILRMSRSRSSDCVENFACTERRESDLLPDYREILRNGRRGAGGRSDLVSLSAI
jgi:hypothetical protein